MKLAVHVGEVRREVTCRAGLKHISRAVIGVVVELHAYRLSDQAVEAAHALAAGMSAYQTEGPPRFRVEVQ